MTQNHVRAFAVEVTAEDGQKDLVLQIEITCESCGPITYVIPGHHLRTIRDVVIDHLDQFPYLNTGTVTQTGPRTKLTVGGELSKKPELN